MLDWRYFLPRPLLGLDIQDDEIRLMQLQGFKKKKKIKLALSCSLPSGAVIHGKIQEPEIVSDCLQELVRKNNLKSSDAAVALPANCVTTHSFSIVKGSHDSEMETEVVSHLSQSMPGGAEGLCYDYAITGSLDDQQCHLLLAVASVEHVNGPVTVAKSAGLKIRIVDVDCYALDRAILFIKKNNLEIDEKWFISYGLALRGMHRW